MHKVYNEIANHFSETRHSPWPQVNEFIHQFEMGSILVDIGCGNGKYLQSNRDIFEVSKAFFFNKCSFDCNYVKKNEVRILKKISIEKILFPLDRM